VDAYDPLLHANVLCAVKLALTLARRVANRYLAEQDRKELEEALDASQSVKVVKHRSRI